MKSSPWCGCRLNFFSQDFLSEECLEQSEKIKPLALWIYSMAILTFRRIHSRDFVELVWRKMGSRKFKAAHFFNFFLPVMSLKLEIEAVICPHLAGTVKLGETSLQGLAPTISCVIESRILEVFECRRHCHWWGHSSCWSRSILTFLDSVQLQLDVASLMNHH